MIHASLWEIFRPLVVSLVLFLCAVGACWHNGVQPQQVYAHADMMLAALSDAVRFDFQGAVKEGEANPLAPRKRTASVASREPRRVPSYALKSGHLPTHAPSYLSAAQSYQYYREMALLKGHRVSRLTVIGLRGLGPSGQRHSSLDNSTPYDDTFVILDPSKERAVELLGSTHAGQATSERSPNGVAQIEPGVYKATPIGLYCGMSAWYVSDRWGSDFVPCRRDIDGNGVIDGGEIRKKFWASEILFHNGCYPYYGSSIGCQVLPPWAMERFIEEVGATTYFDYVLIDANRKL